MLLPRRELGIALACAGLLSMEICLTKIFSIVLWYHFGFLAVSCALLGFASSGVFLALFGRRLTPAEVDHQIAKSAALAAVAAVASLWLTTQTTFDVYTIVQDRTIGVLLAFVLWVALPFFFLGLLISRTLSAYPERVGSLYGADLIGSALGCGLAVLLLEAGVPGPGAILAGAGLVGVAGVCFAGPRLRSQVVALAGAAAPAACLALLDVESAFPLQSPKSKPYYRVEHFDAEMQARSQPTWRRGQLALTDGTTLEVETPMPPALTADGRAVQVETDDGPRTLPLETIRPRSDGPGLDFRVTPWSPYRAWSSLSRVDAFHWPKVHGAWGWWGLSPRARTELTPDQMPRQKGITIDAWAMTSIQRYSGQPLQPEGAPLVDPERARLRVLEYLPAGAVHRIRPRAGHIVCIGAGGGLDLLTAKYFGAHRITGVEINPGVVDAVRGPFAEFAGHLYDEARHPEIEVHVAEGRHFLERSRDRYDVIQLSGVDTFSTSQAGAFALSENFLYTVEAFRTYFAHLQPGGVVTLTRWFVPGERDGRLLPRYDLRLIGMGDAALREIGVAEPARCMFFLESAGFTVMLMKPEGFTAAEVATLREYCAHYGYQILWAPHDQAPAAITALGKSFPNPYAEFFAAKDPAAHLAAQYFDVTPPSDDRPFYFETSRFAHVDRVDHYLNPLGGLTAHGLLAVLLAIVCVLGWLFVVVPMRRLGAAAPFPGSARVRLGVLVYFTAIGFGFIVMEIALAQRFVLFLGHPFQALAVILFSILLFSGIGAAVSARFPLPRFATWLAAGLALVPAFLFPTLFAELLHLELPWRIAIAVGLLAPMGLAMGIPFPAGIRVLARVRPELIPWAWGVNGYTSVLGSVLAVVLSIGFGFLTAFLVAAAVYALGVVGYSLMAIRVPADQPQA
ncbi:MAG: hypothetical protein IT458_11660 [Planctomycetes bacterium]|nr:hypothetical protein [Planctomycetota bacterium]